MDIVRNVQIVCSMPGSTVTDEEDFIVWVFFRQFFQENFHTGSITVRHDQKEGITCHRLCCSICVPILPNVMTRHVWPYPFLAPAVFRLVNPAKACFILEHQAQFAVQPIPYFGSQFHDLRLNFFEASIASSLALFGCWLRGITFRHPCRFKT